MTTQQDPQFSWDDPADDPADDKDIMPGSPGDFYDWEDSDEKDRLVA